MTPHRHADNPGADAPAPSFGRSLRLVGWGLLGIRKSSAHHGDIARIRPLYLVLASLAGLLALVGGLAGLALWMASGT